MNWVTFSSDNGLSLIRRQAIIWTNAGILLIVPLGTNFHEILIEIYAFLFKKMHLKMSSAERRLFHIGLSEFMFRPLFYWRRKPSNITWYVKDTPTAD